MEYVRKIVNSNDIMSALKLPSFLSNKTVEVIVLPLEETPKEVKTTKTLMGSLNKYANNDLQKEEKSAWLKEMGDKYDIA